MPGKAEVGSGDVDYLLRVAVFLLCIGLAGVEDILGVADVGRMIRCV